MLIAVIADIHANAEALEAAFNEIMKERADAIVCLGDIVGYGPDPQDCIERIRDAAPLIVMGNHDFDTVNDVYSPGTNSTARQILEWTRDRLDDNAAKFLSSLPNRIVVPNEFVAVHGCYLNDFHVTGYVTSTMLEANLRAIASHENWPRLALCGHTHIPSCGWLSHGMCIERKLDAPIQWPANAEAILINPGSVGQPRDGDPRAAFALVDTKTRSVEVKRVNYEIEVEAMKIERNGLPILLANRLREGR